jgi:hypothetical protein
VERRHQRDSQRARCVARSHVVQLVPRRLPAREIGGPAPRARHLVAHAAEEAPVHAPPRSIVRPFAARTPATGSHPLTYGATQVAAAHRT